VTPVEEKIREFASALYRETMGRDDQRIHDAALRSEKKDGAL